MFFSGTVRPTKLKLGTQEGNEWMYCVYPNQAAAAYLSLYFQTFKIFITLFSGTVSPTKLKHGTHVNNGWMYPVYWKQAAVYSSLYFFIFLSFAH